ncbi:MAG: 4-hydroxythreonine-4-phosphate dehydrogenase PdxA [Myxococcota bacterium]
MSRPTIAVTMGDPAGIGPEVVVKAATVSDVRRVAQMVVFGDPGVLRHAAEDLRLPLRITEVDDAASAHALEPSHLAVFPVSRLQDHGWGRPTLEGDRAQLQYIEQAADWLRNDKADAMTTAPISKTAIHRAGSAFAGHTDMLGHWFGNKSPVMMLAGPSLKVIPLTIHVSLSDVPPLITEKRVDQVIRVAHEAFQRYFGHPRPRIAVAGLNPHAGEGGIFGHEEVDEIQPAVAKAREAGIDVRGPFPGDSVFHRATTGEFEVVIGMYHDQALIPLKLLDFDRAVNVTLGLPIIRTSVDHGTAYDIAGQGVASARSLIEAVMLAARMVRAERGAHT